MATVHFYGRWSDVKQSDGDSERRQTQNPLEWIERNKHRLGKHLLDKGKSGFRGDKQKALKQLKQFVEDGEIVAGDILLVEHIDRLGRKGIRATQDLINFFFRAGIDIAILFPYEKIYRANATNDIAATIELATLAYAARVYSEVLSYRVTEFHTTARKKAYGGKVVESGPTPAWIKRHKGKFSVIPEAKKAILYAVKRRLQHIGITTILAEVQERFPAIGRSGKWNDVYLSRLLSDRRLLGEWQPHKIIDDERKPHGPPIENYYPRILDDDTFALLQLEKQQAVRADSTGYLNLWTGILTNAFDRCPVQVYSYFQTRADGRRVTFRRLKSADAIKKIKGACTATVELSDFDDSVLRYLTELDLTPFQKGNKSTQDELRAAELQLEQKKKRLAEVMEDDDSPTSLLRPMIERLHVQIGELQQKIDELRARHVRTVEYSLADIKEVWALPNTNETRAKLREAIRRAVKHVVMMPVKLGPQKKSPVGCEIEIEFHSGQRRRILMCGRHTVSHVDNMADEPSLLERQDLKQHAAAVKQWLAESMGLAKPAKAKRA